MRVVPTDPTDPPEPQRRATLASLLALGAASLGLAGRPDPAKWRLRADFEPAAALWLGFDAGHADFTAALVRALQPHVPLKMLTAPGQADAARQALRERGVAATGLQWLAAPQAMYFLRDATVFATAPGGERAMLAFAWNRYGMPGWCRSRHPGDALREAECSAGSAAPHNALLPELAALADAHVFAPGLVMEGGGIETNGQGLLVANESLVMQRNPERPRAALEQALLTLPGIRKVLWVGAGLAEDPPLRATIVGRHVAWGTGGHTDHFLRFADARTLLLAWPDDDETARHPVAALNRQRMRRNWEALARATDADGRPLRVLKVPMPRIVERRVVLSADADPAWSQGWTAEYFPPREGRRQGDVLMQVASCSYLNFVVVNGTVVLPDYQPWGTDPAVQARVRRVFERAFPGRRLQWVDAMSANWVGGGPHCATLNEPQAAD